MYGQRHRQNQNKGFDIFHRLIWNYFNRIVKDLIFLKVHKKLVSSFMVSHYYWFNADLKKNCFMLIMQTSHTYRKQAL